MVSILVIALLFVLIFLGMPVAFSLGITGMIGIYLVTGFDPMVGQFMSTPYRAIASVTLSTIPLFILMAELMNVGGIGRELFDAAKKWVGRMPGGLGIATVLASAGFGAVSGSTTAAAGTFSSIALPEFKRMGYGLPHATGVIAVSGTLAILIPPSIAIIIYGITTETSIGQLLIAGIVPAIITAFMLILGIVIWAKIDPKNMPPGEKFTFKEKFAALNRLWGILLIIAFIFYALYGGVATATEIAGIGAALSFIYLLIMRRLTFDKIKLALYKTVRSSVMIFSIVIGALIFGYFLTLSRMPQQIMTMLGESGLPAFTILLFIVLIYIILGFFMDQISILLITLPIIFPLIESLGFNAIWFGIIVVKTVEIGLVTPPVGMNAFVVSGTTGIPVEKVFRGSAYLLIYEFITLIILLLFPILSTWLPSLMLG